MTKVTSQIDVLVSYLSWVRAILARSLKGTCHESEPYLQGRSEVLTILLTWLKLVMYTSTSESTRADQLVKRSQATRSSIVAQLTQQDTYTKLGYGQDEAQLICNDSSYSTWMLSRYYSKTSGTYLYVDLISHSSESKVYTSIYLYYPEIKLTLNLYSYKYTISQGKISG